MSTGILVPTPTHTSSQKLASIRKDRMLLCSHHKKFPFTSLVSGVHSLSVWTGIVSKRGILHTFVQYVHAHIKAYHFINVNYMYMYCSKSLSAKLFLTYCRDGEVKRTRGYIYSKRINFVSLS